MSLNGLNQFGNKELGFTKPICDMISEIPYRLLCHSIVFVENPRQPSTTDETNGHLIDTPLNLMSNAKDMTFPKSFRLKFENIVRFS